MKRSASSDSLGGMIPLCPSAAEEKAAYERGFQSLLQGLNEDDDSVEDPGQIAEKKRRLSVDQVKALEKNFEVENKLEPERKMKLAQELGLQPRQVAVWFQNRRARWKTKQLEKDYNLLKANHDALKQSFAALQQDKAALVAELEQVKSQLEDDGGKTIVSSAKEEETLVSESENRTCKAVNEESDSSAVVDDQSPQHPVSPIGSLPPAASAINFLPWSAQKAYYHQFLKMEEHNFLNSEEPCDIFSDEQAPCLLWFCSEPWCSNGGAL